VVRNAPTNERRHLEINPLKYKPLKGLLQPPQGGAPSQRRRAPSLSRREGSMPASVFRPESAKPPTSASHSVQKGSCELSRSASHSSASTEHWNENIGDRPIMTMCDLDRPFDPRQLWVDCAELPTRIAPCCTELSLSPAVRTAAAPWDGNAVEWPNEWPLHQSSSEACHGLGCTARTESAHRRNAEEGAANARSCPPEQQGA
jgi:hypothetical protein